MAQKCGTRTLSTQSKDQIFRIRHSQMLAATSGAITMQLNYWITRSIGALAAVAAVAFTTGSASADGYQRGGVCPISRCPHIGGSYVCGDSGSARLAHPPDET